MYSSFRKCFCNKKMIRALSTNEVATALKPFYFTVHPDLFGQFPIQRTVNENSLKQLSSAIESLQQNKKIKPTTLAFYLRPKNKKELNAENFNLVNITLSEQDLRKTIVSILRSCNLSTTFVDGIKDQKSFKDHNINKTNFWENDLEELDNNKIYRTVLMRKKNMSVPDTLKAYLEKHVNNAHIKYEACKLIRSEVKKLETILCKELTLKQIVWDCGWNIYHYRGCLLSFQALTHHHPEHIRILKDRTLVFANCTGISLEGNIMLNSGEVRHNWLDLIKNIEKHDRSLLRIPIFEKTVSTVLLDIRVGRRKFMPKIMVGQYNLQLKQMITTLVDYRGNNSYPKCWPKSLSNYEIVIETEAGPLMLSPSGQFIVPSSCPGFLLVNFITENLDKATKRLNHYDKVKYIEKELHDSTVKELGLINLNNDDSITPDLMTDCCQRLLKHKTVLAPFLKGVMLLVTNYYSVMSDGVLCIPWNWKL